MKIFYVDGTLTFIILATVTAGKVILHLTGPVSIFTFVSSYTLFPLV